MPQRRQTLGEITLEEFLVRAGVVREDNTQFSGFGIEFQQGTRGPNLMGNWLSNGGNQIGIQPSNLPLNVNGVRSKQQQQQRQPILPKQHGLEYGKGLINGLVQGGGIGMVGLGGAVYVSTGSPASQLSSDGIRNSCGDTSSVSHVFNGTLRARKSGTVEKVAERRQRRMIKNRESAAGSRARKQVNMFFIPSNVSIFMLL
ncbi:THO complex subunit 5-like protein [Hibiscus syriacus]|uniref:THO complex subunit 5-like protein n=1 Tax=Hibiscus syriacus TaxID=106335 RepID=A0A6A2YXV2_HIBSY|nr:THO complex subunit 5-like protein [Hibiscus syriacus]